MTSVTSQPTLEERLKAIGAAVGRLGSPGHSSPALGRLAAELSGDGSALVGTDLVTAFPPAALLPDVRLHGYMGVRRLELFRDLLVFLPVLVTWWELRLALIAYGRSVATAASSHTPAASFLLGWQHGFSGQALPLSQTALIVVAIIAAIIGVTAVAHFWRSQIDAANSRAAQRDQLAALLAEGTLLLAQIGHPGAESFTRADVRRMVRGFYDTTGQLTTALQDTAERIGDTGKQIVDALQSGPGARLAKALDDWSEAATALRDLGQSLRTPAEVLARLADLQRQVDDSALRMEGATRGLIAELGEYTEAAGQEAAAHLQMAKDVSAATHDVRSALDTLGTRLEWLGALVEEFDRTRTAGPEDWLT